MDTARRCRLRSYQSGVLPIEVVVPLVGMLVIGIGMLTIVFKREISTGQTLMFAFGIALVSLPLLKDFEWSNGTLKFTTKTEAVEITEQVKALSEQQADLGRTIVSLTQAMGEISGQIDAYEARLNQPPGEGLPPGEGPPPAMAPVPTEFKSLDIEELQRKSQSVIDQSLSTTRSLTEIQNKLQTPPDL